MGQRLTPEQVVERRDTTLVDIRTAEEREVMGWIPGSIHAEGDSVVNVLDDGPVVLTCATGRRSLELANRLEKGNFEVYDLEGGLLGWQARYPICTLPTGGPPDPITVQQFIKRIRSCFVVEAVESGALEQSTTDPLSEVEQLFGDLHPTEPITDVWARIDRLAVRGWRQGHRLDFIVEHVGQFYGMARGLT